MIACTTQNILVFLIALAIGAGGTYYLLSQKQSMPSTALCKSLELNQALRKLWSEHVVWTRQYIVSALANLPDVQTAAKRLMKNQEDIGAAIAQFYGASAGNKLTQLLKEHISIATDVIKYAQLQDQANFKTADEKWHQNAVDIATFLSEANPAWPKDDLISMLNAHLSLTTKEVTARLAQKWDDDVAAFNQVYDQALGMADAFTNGIATQFPS